MDPNKDPRSYLRRYIAEQTYKDWFDRNYPDYTIYEAVGLSELDFQEIKKKFYIKALPIFPIGGAEAAGLMILIFVMRIE